MNRREGRTQPASPADVRARLGRAHQYLEVAQVASSDGDDSTHRDAAAALAVLAGIAAADAICGHVLGRYARGQDHGQAVALLSEVRAAKPSGPTALRKLLDAKDGVHYGTTALTPDKARSLLRASETLVSLADVISREQR